jgi:hypothetical protein
MNFIFKNHIYLPTLIVCDRLYFWATLHSVPATVMLSLVNMKTPISLKFREFKEKLLSKSRCKNCFGDFCYRGIILTII